ncbi:hypothetical protein D3C85_1420260 [compost metagenome]
MHAHFLQRLHRLWDGWQNRDADVLDEHFLGRRSTTLHAIEHDNVSTGFHCQLDVVVRAARANLHVDRFFPIGDFTDFSNLDRQVVRPCPVRVTARRTLIDADRQGSHSSNTLGDFHAQQHAATAGFGALTQNDFDGIGLAQIVRIHAVT